jgi:hypothetical protein
MRRVLAAISNRMHTGDITTLANRSVRLGQGARRLR